MNGDTEFSTFNQPFGNPIQRLLEVIVNGVMACSRCMGLVMGEGMGNDGFLYYTIYCTHYTGTGTGTGNHCFLLCPSLSHAVCMSHHMEMSSRTITKIEKLFRRPTKVTNI